MASDQPSRRDAESHTGGLDLSQVLTDALGQVDADVLAAIEDQATRLHVPSGEVLLREGNPADAVYFVLAGRLCAYTEDEGGGETWLNEIGRGESIGEAGVLSGGVRTASVRAVRESELLRLPRSAFEQIIEQCPDILAAVSKLLTRRLQTIHTPPRRQSATLAVVGLARGLPVAELAADLAEALARFGAVAHLAPQTLDGQTGIPGALEAHPGTPESARLTAWMEARESAHPFVIYQAGDDEGPWTRLCLRQADCVLLVADAAMAPAAGLAKLREWGLAGRPAETRPTLVLLHAANPGAPANTHNWLASEDFAEHFHIRRDTPSDIHRLARCLAGRGVHLVFGGGGARGLAHVGVVRALREAGVPIDRVGGTSMGALVAAAVALEWSDEAMMAMCRRVFLKARPHKAYQLPLLSLIRSRGINAELRRAYGPTHVEDTWRGFFCVSCDLSAGRQVIHDRGEIWQAARASISLPGIFEPVQTGGMILVDGGVLNNLPGDVMHQRHGGALVAVNASQFIEFRPAAGPRRQPKGLWQRLTRKPRRRGPNVLEVLLRTAIVASIPRARRVRRMADLYLELPVEQFGLLEFGAIDAIVRAGYDHARPAVAQWQDSPAYRRCVGAGG